MVLVFFLSLLTPLASADTFWAADLPNYRNWSHTNGDLVITNQGASSATATVTPTGGGPVTLTAAGFGHDLYSMTGMFPGTTKTTTGVYKITTSDPVHVHQFSPWGNTWTNDASFLLEESELGPEYVVFTYREYYATFITIIGTVDGSTVTVTPTATTNAGSGVPSIAAGTSYTTSLNRGQALHIEADAELTGSHVSASHDVAVFSGAECTRVGATACDHLQEQQQPLTFAGDEYVICSTNRIRSTGNDLVRIMSTTTGTTTVTVGPPATTHTLSGLGDYVDVARTSDAYITATQDVLVAQFLAHSSSPGDPAYAVVRPLDSLFTVDQRFPIDEGTPHSTAGSFQHHMLVAYQDGGTVRLDGSSLPAGTLVGSSGYRCAHAPVPGPTIVHRAQADVPATFHIVGTGQAASYWYTGDRLASLTAPDADFTWTATKPCTGDVVTFTDTSTASPGETIVENAWDFGDGATHGPNSPPSSPVTHTYTSAGTFTASVTVEASGGGVASRSYDITVEDCEPPIADFDWRPTPVCALRTTTFDDLSIPASGSHFVKSTWDWDDGTSETHDPWTSSTTHSFPRAGSYSVELTVRDDIGRTGRVTKTVDVISCDQTWAAGDTGGSLTVSAGDDPGCGLGGPESATPGRPEWARAFDHLLGAWVDLPDMPDQRALATGSTLPGSPDRVVIAGGIHDCAFGPRPDVISISPDDATPAWTREAPMRVARIEPVSATVGDSIIVAGGDTTGGDPLDPNSWHVPTDRVERFDGSVWSDLADMPSGVTGAAAVYDPVAQKFVVSGGTGHPQTPSRYVQVLDQVTMEWEGDHLPERRASHELLECRGELYALGGVVGDGRDMYSDTGATSGVLRGLGDWTPAPSMLDRRSHFAGGTIVQTGSVDVPLWMVVHGGYDGAGNILGTTEILPCTGLSPRGGTLTLSIDLDGCGGLERSLLTGSPPVLERWYPLSTCGPRVAEHGSEMHLNNLFVISGVQPGYSPAPCPAGISWRLDVVSGNWIHFDTPRVASPGTGQLSDGTIVVVGGRVEGLAQDGTSNCYVPTDQVWYIDPTTMAWWMGPSLPEGLIAPSVEVVDDAIIVTGGDETGHWAVPRTGEDHRPMRTSRDTYVLRPGAISWQPLLDEQPMPTAFSRMVEHHGAIQLVGGHHHPKASVRAVQAFDAHEAMSNSGTAWHGGHLPWQRMHHVMELCPEGQWAVLGGMTRGPVYFSRSTSGLTNSVMLSDHLHQAWTLDANLPEERAFHVGTSVEAIHLLTGTKNAQHRTSDVVPRLECRDLTEDPDPCTGGLLPPLTIPPPTVPPPTVPPPGPRPPTIAPPPTTSPIDVDVVVAPDEVHLPPRDGDMNLLAGVFFVAVPTGLVLVRRRL